MLKINFALTKRKTQKFNAFLSNLSDKQKELYYLAINIDKRAAIKKK